MPAISGKDGRVTMKAKATVGVAPVMRVTSWEGDVSANMLDANDMESGGWTSAVPDLNSFNPTVTVMDRTDTDIYVDHGVEVGTLVTAELYETKTGYYWTGDFWVVSISPGRAIGATAAYRIQLRNEGEVTREEYVAPGP